MLKVGIIGSGFGTIGLLPAFDSIPLCRIVGVCGAKEDWQSFLERDDLDAVALAVPPFAQYTIAKVAIEKGLHVFAEKPLAANRAQARELLALAQKKKIVHGIDFIFPEIAEWKRVKELLDKNTFGALRHVSVQWDWLNGDIKHGRTTWKSSVRHGGGALSFYFSHGLYYLEQFAGKIQDAKTMFTYPEKRLNGGEAGFDMLLKFSSGATGTVHVSSSTPGLIRHALMFQCERGVITLENNDAIVDDFVVRTYDTKGERTITVKKDTGRTGEDERVKIVRKLAKRFVDACTGGAPMTPSFEDGVRVQELIEKIRAKRIR